MAIFFGIVSLSSTRFPESILDTARLLLRRSGNDSSVHLAGNCAIAWSNLGIWNKESIISSAERISILAGNPVFTDIKSSVTYIRSIELLNNNQEKLSAYLNRCSGTFCGVQIDLNTGTLSIFTDKLGVRTIYYGCQDGFFYFSSSLWILENIDFIKRTPDPESVAEIAAFGYPLKSRSPYKEISTISESEIISASKNGISKSVYWNWNAIKPRNISGDELLNELNSTFNRAITDRLCNEKTETAFLSGGMDSRLIVASIVNSGANVSTLNFAPSGTQDLAFGALAANALGTAHFEFPLGPDDFGNKQILAINAWRQKNPVVPFNGQIWSGDGGSVGLGHVYMNANISDLLSHKNLEKAAELISLSNKWGIPRKLFKKRYRYLSDKISGNILDELNRWNGCLPERSAYLFLMTNDQRRHLADHFENIHLKGFDFKLPFFDSRLIELIVSSPTEEFLGHKIYNAWLLQIRGKISTVPWQSYPGHYPCPLPIPDGLRYQWRDCYDESDTASIVRKSGNECLNYALRNIFSKSPLSVKTLFLASLLTKLKIRDQGFYATYAKPFIRYFIEK